MARILMIAFAAPLLCTSMLAESFSAETAPHNKTEAALRCELGIGSAGCGKNDGCNGGDGPLERVDYLGTNLADEDVYKVHYIHADSIYVIQAPGPDGKMGQFWSTRGNPNQVTSPWIRKVHVTSRAGAYSIYTRPQNAPAAGCNPYLPAEQIDPPAPLPQR